MTTHTSDYLSTVDSKLDACDRLLERLAKMCCEPGRSPRLEAVGAQIQAARASLDALPDEPVGRQREQADEIIELLTAAGSAIGELQIGCCAPARMPLYAETLVNLTDIQLAVNRQVKREH